MGAEKSPPHPPPHNFSNDLFFKKIVSSCHARYWRCDIAGAPNGKLHGKTIAIKDSICVAGVPMMIGSRILEGYVPDVDATVVTRILDAGGRITGKAICESLCLSGGSFTSATGPVWHPHDNTKMTGGSSSGSAALVRGSNGQMITCTHGPFSVGRSLRGHDKSLSELLFKSLKSTVTRLLTVYFSMALSHPKFIHY